MTAPEKDFIRNAKFHASLIKGNKGKVLDIGCYKGYLKDYIPNDYTGVNLKSYGKPYIYAKDLNRDKLPSGKFDIIFACNVIEHLKQSPYLFIKGVIL